MKKTPTTLCAIPIPLMASLIDGFNSFYILVTVILLIILVVKIIYYLFKHYNVKEKISRNYIVFCILSIVYSLIYMFGTMNFIDNYYFLYLILALFIFLIYIFTYKTLRRYFKIILVILSVVSLTIGAISYWQVQKRIDSSSKSENLLDNSGDSSGGFRNLPNVGGCGEAGIF